MKGLSSETLFHFVSKKEYLFDILNNSFRPRFVEERIPFETDELNLVGIPMLCFCDIRLSEVHEHIDWYGSYGIGMKSSWAIKNGLTPIQYYNKNSFAIKDYGRGLRNMRASFKKDIIGNVEYRSVPEWYFDIYTNVWFMKEYRGKQVHRKTQSEKFKKFYDEREWRYIPSFRKLKALPEGVPMSIGKSDIEKYRNDLEYRNKMNEKLGEVTILNYSPEDIAYIIIQNEEERIETINYIRNSKRGYSETEVAILVSKILSLEQIQNDF